MNFLKPHIYRRQIVTTGKFYVGKHKGTDKYYKGGGVEYKKDYKLYVKNIKTDLIEEILEYVEDISKLNEREIYWLEQFDAANNPLYYNKTNKSYGCENHTEEWKINQGIRKQGNTNMLGKHHSEFSKDKIRESKKGVGYKLERNKIIGDKLSGISKPEGFGDNISKKLKGREINWKCKKPYSENFTKINLQTLKKYINNDLITIQYHDKLPLRILNYSRKCQYNKNWNYLTLLCRGLIIDNKGNIVARGFKKFFNFEELQPEQIPNESFELFDKMDGSLGILFYYNGEFHFTSKGSFYSEQSIKGREILEKYNYQELDKNLTYLFEIIYKSNRIVCDYGDKEDLIMLASFGKDGKEFDIYNSNYEDLGFELVKKYRSFKQGFDLLFNTLKKDIKTNQEGYVLKFDNGFRMKIKGEEYIQLHKIKSNLNEKYVWECLSKGIEIPLDNLPDEWDEWLKKTIKDFKYGYYSISENVGKGFDRFVYGKYNDKDKPDRKTFAEWVKTQHPKSQPILFKMYDGKDYSENIWKTLRP